MPKGCLAGKRDRRGNDEAFDGLLYSDRRFEASLLVLVVDGWVVLLGIPEARLKVCHENYELLISIARVVDMCRGL